MISARTLATQVYEYLLRQIILGELTPGSALGESDLAAQLGVSRTPVREALGRLSEYGVVESRPNHGTVVRRLGRDEVLHIHQVREALEGMTAELACGKLTDADFARLDALAEAARDQAAPDYFQAFDAFDVALHGLIADRSGNPILAREVHKLHHMTMLIHDQLESVLIGGHRVEPEEQLEIRRTCWREHVEIIVALKSRRPAKCRAAMTAHIRVTSRFKARLMTPSDPVEGDDEGNGSPRKKRHAAALWSGQGVVHHPSGKSESPRSLA